ncbi:TIGR02452 family protein, partial [bacterium]|nr:TIGR02452 family protein [bacterium]
MAGVSSSHENEYDTDVERAIEESLASHIYSTKARAEQTSKNPIYGFIGGAETCWFNSALQMLLNTQKFREWIQTVISEPTKTDSAVIQKCFFLHNALKFIHDKEKYPFDISKSANRSIDITDFIEFANTIKADNTFHFNAIPTVFRYISDGQQDPFLFIGDITDCINYGTYQQQYINIYHNQSNNEIEWSKSDSGFTSSDSFITNLVDSVELPTRITKENIIRMIAAKALIRNRSHEFTSLQQLLDIIPKPLKKMSRQTDQRLVEKSRFLSDLKLFSTVSLYDRFNSVKSDSSINTLNKYIDQVLTNLTTLYNKPRINFSYGQNVTTWFTQFINVTPLILNTIHTTDVLGNITSTDIRFIQDETVDIIHVINTIFKTVSNKTINDLLSALKKSSDPIHHKIASVLDFHEDPTLKPILQGMYDDYFTYVSGDYIMIQIASMDLDNNRYNHLSNIRYDLIQPNHVFTFGDNQYFLTCIMWHISGDIKHGHYVSEINIVNPPHTSIERGLYLCNDSITTKIDRWNSLPSGTNMIPSLFVFENAALTPELSMVDFPVSHTPEPSAAGLMSKSISPMKTVASVAATAAAAIAIGSIRKKTFFTPSPVSSMILNTPEGVIAEIKTRIDEITSTKNKEDGTPVNIAILVNGGSFNPIHYGHLEMYTASRHLLHESRGKDKITFTDVLIIYVVSPFNDLKDKNRSDLTKILYDTQYRINMCRESFASIGDIPDGNYTTSDSKHLSKNMFVWPVELSNAYSIHTSIMRSLNDSGGVDLSKSKITFYGLAGSDKVLNKGGAFNPENFIDQSFYFSNGIAGNSIIVGRGPSDTFSGFWEWLQNEKAKNTTGYDKYIDNGDKVTLTTSQEISSSDIQTQIPVLIQYAKQISVYSGKRITNPDCKDTSCVPFQTQNDVIDEFVKRSDILRRYVPNSILFKLLAYNEDTHPTLARHTPDTFVAGYKQYRRFHFRNSLDLIHQNKAVNDSIPPQTERIINDITTKVDVSKMSNDDNIEFVQMTTGRAASFYSGVGSTTGPKNVTILNFANADVLGGGVMLGSTAQEETLIMMAPLLAVSLSTIGCYEKNDKTYYKGWEHNNWNKKIYYTTNKLPFEITDEFTFTLPSNSSKNSYNVISAAAYEWGKSNNYQTQYTDIQSSEFKTSMIRMIQNIAYVAAVEQKSNVLILGAWGCGAFAPKNTSSNPNIQEQYIQVVAGLFHEALYANIPDTSNAFKDLFEKVVFPIPDCKTYDIFKGTFESTTIAIDIGDQGGEGGGVSPSKTLLSNTSSHVELPPPPYITLTNIIASIDSGIDHFVEQMSNRNPLREISVNDQSSISENKEKTKFTRVDGNFPKITVPLFEQMIYHRAGSMNMNPLEIFIPTNYKINFKEINEYFQEMVRRNDPETQELVS